MLSQGRIRDRSLIEETEVLTVKVGIVGPQSSCESIERALHYIDPEVEVRCYVREQVSACAEVYPDCERDCDAVLFTGRAVERYVKSSCRITKPTAAVARSAVAVAAAFLSMQKQNLSFDSLSIDIVEPQVIEDVLDAFQILAKNIYSYPTPEDIEEERYVRWHKALQDEGYTAVALTSLQWVFQQLQEDGYQAIYMGPTRTTTRLALERLKADLAINRAEQAQIATEILQLRDAQVLEENYYSGHDRKGGHLQEHHPLQQGAPGRRVPGGPLGVHHLRQRRRATGAAEPAATDRTAKAGPSAGVPPERRDGHGLHRLPGGDQRQEGAALRPEQGQPRGALLRG